MTQSTLALPGERSLAETGFFLVPLALFDAGLPPAAVALYAWIARQADSGADEPADMLPPALALGITPEAAMIAMNELVARNMMEVDSEGWTMTPVKSWEKI